MQLSNILNRLVAPKYRKIMSQTAQELMEYRLNFVLSFAAALIPLLAMVCLWKTAYTQPGARLGGYALADIITYYLISSWVSSLTHPSIRMEMIGDIRGGALSLYLIRPLNYLKMRFCIELTAQFFFGLIGMVVIGAFAMIVVRHLVLPSQLVTIVLFLLVVALAYLLATTMGYTLVGLAFWKGDVSSLNTLQYVTMPLLTGAILPLDLFPAPVSHIFRLLPFQYLVFFPTRIFFEKIPRGGVHWTLLVLLGWLIFFYVLMILVWRRGLAHFEAYGG